MRQLSKVKTTRARVSGSPLHSQGEGEGEGFVQCNGSVQQTPHLSPLPFYEGRGGKAWIRSGANFVSFGNSTSSVPTCVATRLRAGAVACAVLSAVIESAHNAEDSGRYSTMKYAFRRQPGPEQRGVRESPQVC